MSLPLRRHSAGKATGDITKGGLPAGPGCRGGLTLGCSADTHGLPPVPRRMDPRPAPRALGMDGGKLSLVPVACSSAVAQGAGRGSFPTSCPKTRATSGSYDLTADVAWRIKGTGRFRIHQASSPPANSTPHPALGGTMLGVWGDDSPPRWRICTSRASGTFVARHRPEYARKCPTLVVQCPNASGQSICMRGFDIPPSYWYQA